MKEDLQKAKDLMDNEQYELAIDILNNLKNLSLKAENFRLLFLANCLYNIEEYYSSIEIADKLLQKDHGNEYASQIKYLSHWGLKDYDKALDEIINFLSGNEAILYKVTLEELLMDIKKGFINEEDKVHKIRELAIQNNINL